MKLTRGDYSFNSDADGKFGKRLIEVASIDIPDDFDPERTCRMIEKMEEMVEYINDNLLYAP